MKFTLAFFLLLLGFIVSGCKKDNEDPTEPEKTRTVIVYIIANNNLSKYAFVDINEMETGWNDSYSGDLIVFYNNSSGENTLYKISHDEDPETITSEIIKSYPSDAKVCTKEFLQEVISDVQNLFPADSYALDLWSHGTGWLPKDQSYPLTVFDTYSKLFTESTIKKDTLDLRGTFSAFGYDGKHIATFEAYDLAEALSPYKFDFLFFDACHMASVECEYQMKNCCKYYIASVAETLIYGAPYDEIVSDMFQQPDANVVSIAEKFYQFYQNSETQSAAISVIDCSKLDNVAAELKQIVTKNPQVPLATIQQYGRYYSGYHNCIYDLEDFVQKTWGTDKTSAFSSALSKAVIYKGATSKIMNDIDIIHHSGLSCYIPRNNQTNCLNIFRTYYSWAAASGLGEMVN